MKKLFLVFVIAFSCLCLNAQVFSKFTTSQNRAKFYRNLVDNSIRKNLSLPLSAETEANWEDAFYSIELIGFKEDWVKTKIKTALDTISKRYAAQDLASTIAIDISFERSLLEMMYVIYPTDFKDEVIRLIKITPSTKIFAMGAAYLENAGEDPITVFGIGMSSLVAVRTMDGEPKLIDLMQAVPSTIPKKKWDKKLEDLFERKFDSSTIIYSIQRRNRNYPGIAIVKDKSGNFVKNTDGTIFSVPQLARSVSNMPGYLTNGNTPQGIFRMDGFAVSKSNFIGPTENLQLTMPYETSVKHFLKDSTIKDSIWTEKLYQSLLPKSLRDDNGLMGSYFASKFGRTEIIAHGTAVDPEYYKGQTYYPLTPTAGCLCTKETWFADGTRAVSDQQRLVDAVKKAGGADGYIIVLELDDEQKAVSVEEVLKYIK